MFMVLGLSVFVDLIVAVAADLAAASLLFVKRMSDLQMQNIRASETDFEAVPLNPEEMVILERHKGEILHVRLSGAISFGSAKDLTQRLTHVSAYRALIIEMADVVLVDTSASLALEEIIESVQGQKIAVYLVGLQASVRKILDQLRVLEKIDRDHVFDDRLTVFRHVAALAQTWRAGAAPS